MLQPTTKDKRVARLLGGPFANEPFDQIGTYWKGSHGDAPDYMERRRGDLTYTYTRGGAAGELHRDRRRYR
jgi:hypothetical protein